MFEQNTRKKTLKPDFLEDNGSTFESHNHHHPTMDGEPSLNVEDEIQKEFEREEEKTQSSEDNRADGLTWCIAAVSPSFQNEKLYTVEQVRINRFDLIVNP